MTDPADLWDFDDPTASEHRLREAAVGPDRAVMLTQAARALGLQQEYDAGHALLDEVAALPLDDEARVRVLLERGRLLRSAGDAEGARPHFEAAAQTASSARLDALHVDALHMLALVAEPTERDAITGRALAIARASTDPAVRDWDATLLNNLGMSQAEAGDFEAALISFEDALAARTRLGDPARTRVARWMVAWALRHLGRRVEALMLQRHLRAELDAAGLTDPHVDEELSILEAEDPQTRR